MSKKQGAIATVPVAMAHAVTPERAVRLYHLVTLLGQKPRTRTELTTALGLNVRGFYRELEVLRAWGVSVALVRNRYVLKEEVARAIERLPFPDPGLTIGEARQLARSGRSRAHQKLRVQLNRLAK
jgi:hypothetical protein